VTLSGQTHLFHFEFGTDPARDYIQRPGPYIDPIFLGSSFENRGERMWGE